MSEIPLKQVSSRNAGGSAVRHRMTFVWLAMLGITAILLFSPMPDWFQSAILSAWLDALHFPLFLGLGWFAGRSLQGRSRSANRLGLAALLAFACLTEPLQQSFGREASVHDLFANLTGAGAGFLLAGIERRRLAAILTVLALAALFLVRPVAAMSFAWTTNRGLPDAVFRFGRAGAAEFLTPKPGTILAIEKEDGGDGLRMVLERGEGRGVGIDLSGQDWRRYRMLGFTFSNPGPAMRLGLRIDDEGETGGHGQRFNGWLEIPPGDPVTCRVPLAGIRDGPVDRPLDLGAIRKIVLHTGRIERDRTLFLNRIFLE